MQERIRAAVGGRAPQGFTLVELLVVIAILAVLAVTVVVVLNPAELLRQSRDSTRLSDMASINRALGLFLADGGTWSGDSGPRCTANGTSPIGGTCTVTTSTVVTGSGWVDVNLTTMSTGAPLSSLPLDPTNDTTYFYAFERTSSMTYELNARMESVKYATTSATQVITKDGGNNANWYEVGNDPGLDL